MLDQRALLKVRVKRGGTIQEITDFLNALKTAHDSLYALDLIMSRVDEVAKAFEGNSLILRPNILELLNPVADPSSVIFPHQRLYLHSVVIRSPGFWEFLGSLNPLQQIREYLNDRHERRKDRAYREKEESEKLQLENERRRFELVRDKVQYLRSIGFPEQELRYLLTRLAFDPLARLDSFQDQGMIIDAKTQEIKGEENEEPATA